MGANYSAQKTYRFSLKYRIDDIHNDLIKILNNDDSVTMVNDKNTQNEMFPRKKIDTFNPNELVIYVIKTSKKCHFIDDMIFILGTTKIDNYIYVQSTSRIGYYDFNQNSKQIDEIMYLILDTYV